MSRRIAEAVEEGSHLVIRAGTGTGKSLAYLVPAILSGQRTIVATATKALQDQLAGKDLPFLVEHLDHQFNFAVLKGRSNYVCRQRLDEVAESEAQQALDGLAETANADELQAIVAWADTTETGDRADLPIQPTPATWAAVSVGSHECPGAVKCPRGGDCFSEKARSAAAGADVVVTNLHLYGIDVATDGMILPEHDLAILDEAHQTEDVLAQACGFELRGGRFTALVRNARSILTGSRAIEDVNNLVGHLVDALAGHVGRRLVPAEDGDLRSALELARSRLAGLRSELMNIPTTGPGDVAARRARALQTLGTLSGDVDAALNLDGGPMPGAKVAWVEGRADRPVLHVAPVEVGEVLNQKLWGDRTVVLTSATVPANLADRLGMTDHPHRFEDVGSPFDFDRQALLYCATSLPDPREADYRAACHDEIERLAVAAGGRMLALFTSRRALDEAVEALRDRLPWTVLHQDDLPKPLLMARFAEDETSCLFGTKGLWHGIDVPGTSLSLVVIDRIPFPRPDDPLLSARRDLVGSGAFREIDLPLAATELAQGAGRLIRTGDDIGVVAVLDRRLATNKSYRWDLLEAMPPMARTSDPREVVSFLEGLRRSAE